LIIFAWPFHRLSKREGSRGWVSTCSRRACLHPCQDKPWTHARPTPPHCPPPTLPSSLAPSLVPSIFWRHPWEWLVHHTRFVAAHAHGASDHDDSLHASLSLRGTLWTLPRTEQPRRPPTNAVHAAVTTATSTTSRPYSGSSRRQLHSPQHATTPETHAATASTQPVNAIADASSRRSVEYLAGGRKTRAIFLPLAADDVRVCPRRGILARTRSPAA
jgi:hypothetical protein